MRTVETASQRRVVSRRCSLEELASYAVGCMMGRYSLDAPGLIFAHGGNEGFEPSRYTTFPADADGTVPLTDTNWFDVDGQSTGSIRLRPWGKNEKRRSS